MGNDSSSSMSEGSGFTGKLNKSYDFMTEVSDPRFGDIYVYKHRTEKKFIAKRGQMCNSEEEQLALIRSCRNRQHLKHKYVLQLLHFCEAGEDNICGDFNKITIYFEYYFHDLQKELQRRRDNGKEYFNESELWYLLDSMVQACSFFEKQKLSHGDIRPSNILLTNDGQVKVGEQGILLVDQSGYYKMLSRREKSYLTPSLLRSLSVGELKPFHNTQKTDVYSLGMSLLETASLCEPMSAYDMDNYTVNRQALEYLFGQCRGRYSDFLMNVLRDMLIEDENERPSFQTLASILQPFQNTIQSSNNGNNNNNNIQNSQIIQNNSNQILTPQPIQQSPLLQQSYVFVPPFVSPQTQFQIQNNAVAFIQPAPTQAANLTTIPGVQPTLETQGNTQSISFQPSQIQGLTSQQLQQTQIVSNQQAYTQSQQPKIQPLQNQNLLAATSEQLQLQIQQLQQQQLALQKQYQAGLLNQSNLPIQPALNNSVPTAQGINYNPAFQQPISSSFVQAPLQQQQQQAIQFQQRSQIPLPRQVYQQSQQQNQLISFQNPQVTLLPQSQLIQSLNTHQQSNQISEPNQAVSFQPSQQNQSTFQPANYQRAGNQEVELGFLKQVNDALANSNQTLQLNQDNQSTASQQRKPNLSQEYEVNVQPWQSTSNQQNNTQQQPVLVNQQTYQLGQLQGIPQHQQSLNNPSIQNLAAPLNQTNGFYQSFTHIQQPQTADNNQQ